MSKKKILFVAWSLESGGAERALVNLLNMMDYDKYQVDLQLFENKGINFRYLPKNVTVLKAITDIPQNKWLFNNGIHFASEALRRGKIKLSYKRLLMPYIFSSKYGNAVNKKINAWESIQPELMKNETQYDIAVAYLQGFPIYHILDNVKARRKIGWMHTDYGQVNGKGSLLEEAYYQKLDALVTVSERCVDSLKKAFPKLSNIKLLNNLNSPELITKLSNEFTPAELIDNVPIILSIGRLSKVKGFDYAIKAAYEMKKMGQKFAWYIMGEGPLKEELKNLIVEYELTDMFFLLGVKENPYPYIKTATIIAQTSRYEGKSVVLDEAKILGKKIVVTNYASVNDQIIDGENGIIVEMDGKSIADGIMRALTDDYIDMKLQRNRNMFENEQNIWLEKHYDLFENSEQK